ncbi:MAG: hypothetical protein ABW224_16585 [Kibdelosporangium sp.]
MKARSVLAVASVVASASIAVAMPASAGLTTYCDGEAGAVNVPGDLRVASTRSCVLDGTTVTGTVTVEAGANLVITGGTFNGAVSVLDDGFFDAKGTVLKGSLTATDGYGFFLSGTKSGSIRVVSSQHPERGTYAYLNAATVDGDVTSGVGEVFAQDSTLNGSVTGTNVAYLDLVNSVVADNLSVSGAVLGSVFCSSEVYGDATYSNNQGTLQIGGNGPIVGCDQASYWDGNLTVSGNHADSQVSNNIVRGNLSGADNDPAPTGANNRVRGTTSGQFVNLAAPAAARSAAAGAHERADVDSRRTEAKAEAKAAGPAAL